MVKVVVKWGKLKYDLDLDPAEGFEVLQGQLYCLTNVPVERQKIMVKGRKLKEDSDLLKIKEKAKMMLMGSADALKEPVAKVIFEEDLTDEQRGILLADVGAGLNNLGNTCYLNSTLQCLRHVKELNTALKTYTPPQQGGGDLGPAMTASMGSLFAALDNSSTPVTPNVFLQMFRSLYPQFAETSPQGHYMQQDADESLHQIMTTLASNLKQLPKGVDSSAQNMVDYLFGIPMKSSMKCVESPDEPVKEEMTMSRKLSCNISLEVKYMRDGIKLGLEETLEKRSAVLGRNAQYVRTNKITGLPKYLSVQMVRFFWKQDKNIKSKMLKKVAYPTDFDLLEFCDSKLKRDLTAARSSLMDEENKKLGLNSLDTKKTKGGKEEKKEGEGKTEEKAEEKNEQPPAEVDSSGHYNLIGVVTHKGRSADSGHYVGWCRQKDDDWMKFDDDVVTNVKTEEILALSGGGDWHTTYLCFYERVDDMVAFRERDTKRKQTEAKAAADKSEDPTKSVAMEE